MNMQQATEGIAFDAFVRAVAFVDGPSREVPDLRPAAPWDLISEATDEARWKVDDECAR